MSFFPARDHRLDMGERGMTRAEVSNRNLHVPCRMAIAVSSRQIQSRLPRFKDRHLQGGYLTHLGTLCLGQQHQRAQLTTAPVIQFIKYDEVGQKVNKLVWDDHTLNPMELVEAVWLEVPDFRERYELPDGLYRQNVPAFDEVVVVRELLVNALVHRPYTQRERIALGLLAQHDAMTARELAAVLELPSVEALQPWINRLLEWDLIQSAGRTYATPCNAWVREMPPPTVQAYDHPCGAVSPSVAS